MHINIFSQNFLKQLHLKQIAFIKIMNSKLPLFIIGYEMFWGKKWLFSKKNKSTDLKIMKI